MEPYLRLKADLERANLFKKRPGFYLLYTLVVLSCLALSFACLMLVDNAIIQLLNAVFLGLTFMQLGFLGHDIAHHQVFSSATADTWVGSLVYALGLGISLDFWYTGHNEHHKNTNKIGEDPDIDLPLVFTDEQLATRGPWYRKYILPHQHWYFFLFMPLAYFNYVLKSIPLSWGTFSRPIRLFELVLMGIHFVFLFWIIFASLGPWLGIAFLIVTMLVAGAYAGFSFAPNHKGEEVLGADEKVTYRTQIICTRNIYASRFTDLALGGLNYQIEHHLFSYLPRPNLGKAQKIVKGFCDAEGLPYHETTFWGSVMEMYAALRHFSLQK